MNVNVKNRYSACFLHFSISLFIFLIFVYVLLTFWYPSPFFTAAGGWQGLRIVAAVDLVLGPLLTLIVYDTTKTKLAIFTDYTVIVILQLTALAWGVFTVYEQRPVAIVFWEQSFYSVPANAFKEHGITLSDMKNFDNNTPTYLYAEKPVTEKAYNEMVQAVIQEHIPPYQQLNLLRPLSSNINEVLSHSIDIAEIMANNQEMKEEIESVLVKTQTMITDNYYLPLNSKYRNIILIFNQHGVISGTASAPYKESP